MRELTSKETNEISGGCIFHWIGDLADAIGDFCHRVFGW
jgi:hypothetical protein